MRGAVVAVLVLACGPAGAQTIETRAYPLAAFTGLDKITGRITAFEVYLDETVQFGSLLVTPRVCRAASQDETQHALSFVEVNEVALDASVTRVLTGWIFADSPALNAIDDPVYDVWLTGCRETSNIPPPGQR